MGVVVVVLKVVAPVKVELNAVEVTLALTEMGPTVADGLLVTGAETTSVEPLHTVVKVVWRCKRLLKDMEECQPTKLVSDPVIGVVVVVLAEDVAFALTDTGPTVALGLLVTGAETTSVLPLQMVVKVV